MFDRLHLREQTTIYFKNKRVYQFRHYKCKTAVFRHELQHIHNRIKHNEQNKASE